MTQSRSSLISLSDTPYYHCISRCVRRAFLCGEDKYSGQCFNHRRQWIVDRILFISSVFAIDICAYSIMSNHYHLVLHANEVEIAACSDEEICKRWYQLYSGSSVVSRWLKNELNTQVEINQALAIITTWRHRLVDISWFMRSLNEFIARKANKEEGCTGRFWEGRFKSQALLDNRALLTCMAYVDLNPIRAQAAECIEKSEYTSIFERIYNRCSESDNTSAGNIRKPLLAFTALNETQSEGLPYSLIDYIELIDWTGRVVRDGKSGQIVDKRPSLLSTLSLENEAWFELACNFGRDYYGAVGGSECLDAFAKNTGKRWIAGKTKLQVLLH